MISFVIMTIVCWNRNKLYDNYGFIVTVNLVKRPIFCLFNCTKRHLLHGKLGRIHGTELPTEVVLRNLFVFINLKMNRLNVQSRPMGVVNVVIFCSRISNAL